MAMCPLLKAECVKDKCQWWFKAEDDNYSNCSVALLPGRLDHLYDQLDTMSSTVAQIQIDVGVILTSSENM